MNGRFIIIEGQGFTGKTTQANMLAQVLNEKGIETISLRHPGGTDYAEKMRQQLLEKKQAGVLTPDEELDFLFKALKSLVDELIIPSLNSGKWIILTRFIPSAIVYQGYQEGLDKNMIKTQGEKAAQNIKPDLSILIDVPAEEILKRENEGRGTEIHAYNSFDLETLQTRREGFLQIFEEMDDAVILDGSKTKEEIHSEIWKEVETRFIIN